MNTENKKIARSIVLLARELLAKERIQIHLRSRTQETPRSGIPKGTARMEQRNKMEKNDLNVEEFLKKLSTQGKLKEINQDVPINQQMSLEEYREQVFLWMILKGSYTIQATKDSMELYWNDFQEFYDDNLSLAATGSGMSMRYL